MFPKEVKLNSCHLLLAFQAGFFQAIFHRGVMFSFYLQIGSFSPSCRASGFSAYFLQELQHLESSCFQSSSNITIVSLLYQGTYFYLTRPLISAAWIKVWLCWSENGRQTWLSLKAWVVPSTPITTRL